MIYRQQISQTAVSFTTNAKYFKVLSISEGAVCHFIGDGWDLETTIKKGLSLDFTEFSTPCTRIIFTSNDVQRVEFWASKARAEDSSLSGVLGVDSANRVNYPNKQTINSSTEVLPFDATRNAGTYQISAPCYVNDDVNGIQLVSGVYQWTNKQPLVLIPVAGSVVVRVMDELF